MNQNGKKEVNGLSEWEVKRVCKYRSKTWGE